MIAVQIVLHPSIRMSYNTAAILESIGLQEKSTAQPQHQSAAAWSQFIEFPWKEKIARKRYSIP
jgi:hypothetical protein